MVLVVILANLCYLKYMQKYTTIKLLILYMPRKSVFEVGQMVPILRVIKTFPLSAAAQNNLSPVCLTIQMKMVTALIHVV